MLKIFLKNGLRTYKFRNSQLKPIGFVEEEKKGSIFIYYSKEALSVSRGIVITSLEAIEEQADTITHWTPNVYRYGEYTDTRRLVVKGHFEKICVKSIRLLLISIQKKIMKEKLSWHVSIS